MSTRREPSFNQEFTAQDYVNETETLNSTPSDYSPEHVEIYKGAVGKSELESFSKYLDTDLDFEGYDVEEPEIRVDWYTEEDSNIGRLETIVERKYVSEKVPEKWAKTVPQIPLARNFLYNETVDYEVENIGWEEAVKKLDETGIKPSRNRV